MAICTGRLPLASSHVHCPDFPPPKPAHLPVAGAAGGIGAALERRAGMAEMCVSRPNGWLVPWFAGSLVPSGSHQSPQNGGPLSLTHFSRSARDWLITSQSDATALIRSAATQVGPLLSLGQLRQSHPVCAISGPGSHSQLQVHRSPRRHWLADWVGC